MQNNKENFNQGKLIAVGRVVSAHGLKGEFKVYPLSNIEERYNFLKRIFFEMHDGQLIDTEVEYSKPFGEYEIIKIIGIDNRDDAEKFKGAYISIRIEDIAPLDENSFYVFDLEGLNVFSPEGDMLGTVIRVEEYPSNAIFVVKTENSEIMVPAVHEYIKEVNIAEKKLVAILPGIVSTDI